MLELTVAVLAVVLAGSASAAGWRDLRIDASSEASFDQSVELFRDKLPKSRKHAFERALQDIWTQRTFEQREYTKQDYYAQLDGLRYEQVVRVLDPTGAQAKRYRAEYYGSQPPALSFSRMNIGNGVPVRPPGYGQGTSVQ